MKKVIDISYAQGKVDFKKVKASGIDGVVIRVGYGKGNVDEFFESNIKGAIKAKMHIGVYWFSYAYTDTMAKNEAKYIDKLIKPYKDSIDMPVFFDWEYDSMDYAIKNGVTLNKTDYKGWKAVVTPMVKKFCEEITKLGYEAGYYLNEDYKNYIDESKLKKYKRWFSYPGKDYNDCYLFQYSFEGKVNGISGDVDMDYLYGSYIGESKEDTQTTKPSKTKGKGYDGVFPRVSPMLRKGSSGLQVQRLQKFLNWFGDYKLKVDGIFGKNTEKAVRDFQQKVFPDDPSEWDGIFGKNSLAKAQAVKK